MENNICTYNLTQLEEILYRFNQPKYRAKQLYEWLHTHNAASYEEMTNLPKTLREQLEINYPLSKPEFIKRDISADSTRKYVLQLSDGAAVETVGIPAEANRLTVCFSTQSGCAMGCTFCATGHEGFTRNLNSQEIVDQIIHVQKDFGRHVSNVVAMGQGEPFLNYNAVLSALRRINTDDGLKIGARHITVSTCGIIDGIRKFACEAEQFVLAISLHSAIQFKRDALMPKLANQPLTKLHEALSHYNDIKGRRITLEYLMLDGFNDSDEDLQALLDFCHGIFCHVNLIPYNTTNDLFKSSPTKRMNFWLSTLQSNNISTTIRNSRGADINGACGQLKQTITQ